MEFSSAKGHFKRLFCCKARKNAGDSLSNNLHFRSVLIIGLPPFYSMYGDILADWAGLANNFDFCRLAAILRKSHLIGAGYEETYYFSYGGFVFAWGVELERPCAFWVF